MTTLDTKCFILSTHPPCIRSSMNVRPPRPLNTTSTNHRHLTHTNNNDTTNNQHCRVQRDNRHSSLAALLWESPLYKKWATLNWLDRLGRVKAGRTHLAHKFHSHSWPYGLNSRPFRPFAIRTRVSSVSVETRSRPQPDNKTTDLTNDNCITGETIVLSNNTLCSNWRNLLFLVYKHLLQFV